MFLDDVVDDFCGQFIGDVLIELVGAALEGGFRWSKRTDTSGRSRYDFFDSLHIAMHLTLHFVSEDISKYYLAGEN